MTRLLILALAWAGSLIGAGWWGYDAGKDRELASQYRESAAAANAAQAAAEAAAKAIASIEVRNVTINKALEREVRFHEVFRDCRSGNDAVRLLNTTEGIAGAASAAGGSVVPASGATR